LSLASALFTLRRELAVAQFWTFVMSSEVETSLDLSVDMGNTIHTLPVAQRPTLVILRLVHTSRDFSTPLRFARNDSWRYE
jgi:hypothetical protein